MFNKKKNIYDSKNHCCNTHFCTILNSCVEDAIFSLIFILKVLIRESQNKDFQILFENLQKKNNAKW